MKRLLAILLCCALLSAVLPGCGQKSTYRKNAALAAEKDVVTLHLLGSTPSFKAMEDVIDGFTALYPNCSVEYEYLQNYSDSLLTRLSGSDDADLFVTTNITTGSPLEPYALELKSQADALDLSHTYEGLIRNFTITSDGRDDLYAVPLGGEIRGMYVNKTLLAAHGLPVPTNFSELFSDCQALRDAGLVPLQGNPGSFGQLLMYPYVCSLIANADDYQAAYDEVAACRAGVSERFREPMARLYELTENGFYNYKYVETNDAAFTDGTDEEAARSFLSLAKADDGSYVKKDDVGTAAFMPGTMSFKSTLDKMKADYHSAIDYEFILSPVGDDGGFAYLSPAKGIAVCRRSTHADWALEFLNYLFSEDVSKSFAAAQNVIPNTPDAPSAITAAFSIDEKRVCQLGQVTFDYVFYDVMKKALTDVSKGNNPKYMQADGTMYPLDHYMQALESAFAEQRK